jgi:replicative DNA helicase
MSFKNSLKFIKQRQANEINGIPTKFETLKRVLPAWDINTTTILAAATGAGKTSWAWRHAVLDVLDFVKEHPEIEVEIYYFSLELVRLELDIKVFSSLLYEKFHKTYNKTIFTGLTDERLTKEELDYLNNECREYLEFLESKVHIIDSANTPNSAFAYLVEKVAKKAGYKFIIIDTVNAFSADAGENKMDSIKKWNQDYALKVFRNQFDCTLVQVSQIDKSSTTRQFSSKGESVYEKYIPTLEGLGNDKEASNSASLVLGLLNPLTYHIPEVDGYHPAKFEGGFRMLYVLKNNFGDSNLAIPYYFEGVTNTWTEIQEDPVEFKDPKLYEKYVKKDLILPKIISNFIR